MYRQISGDVNAADDGGLFYGAEQEMILQIRNMDVDTGGAVHGFLLQWREWEPEVWRYDGNINSIMDGCKGCEGCYQLLAEEAMRYYGDDYPYTCDTWPQVMQRLRGELTRESFWNYQDEWDYHDWSDGLPSY